MTYGGNIRAAAEARGMKLGNPRSGRRMNPANIRALRRSIRRLGSAKKVFAQVFSAVHGHQPQKVKPKFGRKKR
jgi:D-tyrosyl-tRNA(Tyr) deacylase